MRYRFTGTFTAAVRAKSIALANAIVKQLDVRFEDEDLKEPGFSRTLTLADEFELRLTWYPDDESEVLVTALEAVTAFSILQHAVTASPAVSPFLGAGSRFVTKLTLSDDPELGFPSVVDGLVSIPKLSEYSNITIGSSSTLYTSASTPSYNNHTLPAIAKGLGPQSMRMRMYPPYPSNQGAPSSSTGSLYVPNSMLPTSIKDSTLVPGVAALLLSVGSIQAIVNGYAIFSLAYGSSFYYITHTYLIPNPDFDAFYAHVLVIPVSELPAYWTPLDRIEFTDVESGSAAPEYLAPDGVTVYDSVVWPTFTLAGAGSTTISISDTGGELSTTKPSLRFTITVNSWRFAGDGTTPLISGFAQPYFGSEVSELRWVSENATIQDTRQLLPNPSARVFYELSISYESLYGMLISYTDPDYVSDTVDTNSSIEFSHGEPGLYTRAYTLRNSSGTAPRIAKRVIPNTSGVLELAEDLPTDEVSVTSNQSYTYFFLDWPDFAIYGPNGESDQTITGSRPVYTVHNGELVLVATHTVSDYWDGTEQADYDVAWDTVMSHGGTPPEFSVDRSFCTVYPTSVGTFYYFDRAVDYLWLDDELVCSEPEGLVVTSAPASTNTPQSITPAHVTVGEFSGVISVSASITFNRFREETWQGATGDLPIVSNASFASYSRVAIGIDNFTLDTDQYEHFWFGAYPFNVLSATYASTIGPPGQHGVDPPNLQMPSIQAARTSYSIPNTTNKGGDLVGVSIFAPKLIGDNDGVCIATPLISRSDFILAWYAYDLDPTPTNKTYLESLYVVNVNNFASRELIEFVLASYSATQVIIVNPG